MLPQQAKVTFLKTVAITSAVLFVVILLMLLQKELEIVYGLLLGGIMAIVNFALISISVTNLMAKEGRQRFKWILHSFFRSLITIAVLATSFLSDNISFFSTAIGLLSVKYTILLQGIYQSYKYKIANWKQE